MGEVQTGGVQLGSLNRTELLQLARAQGIGILRDSVPTKRLVELVGGGTPEPAELTGPSRHRLEVFVQANISSLRSQLPGCDGHCTTFGCSEVRHSDCMTGLERAW